MNSTTEQDVNLSTKVISVLNRGDYDASNFDKQPEDTIKMLEYKAEACYSNHLIGVRLAQIRDFDGRYIMMGYGTIINSPNIIK